MNFPGILQEIADIAGADAALAIQRSYGGQQKFFNAHLEEDDWLVRLVGREAAEAISHHLTSRNARLRVDIPVGDTGAYLAGRLGRQKAMIAVINRGGSSNQIAAAGGITNRSARRFRGKYLASLRKKASRS